MAESAASVSGSQGLRQLSGAEIGELQSTERAMKVAVADSCHSTNTSTIEGKLNDSLGVSVGTNSVKEILRDSHLPVAGST